MLQGLLFLFVLFLLAVMIAVMVVLRFFHKGIDMLRKAMGGGRRNGRDDGDDMRRRSSQYAYGAGAGRRKREEARSNGRTTYSPSDGVTVVDCRDPDVAARKIFSPDEGEYVDFREE